MRTTIRMNETIARRAKQYAARTNRSFTELVEEAVLTFMSQPAPKPRRINLPVAGDPQHKVTLEEIQAAIDETDAEFYMKKIGPPHARS